MTETDAFKRGVSPDVDGLALITGRFYHVCSLGLRWGSDRLICTGVSGFLILLKVALLTFAAFAKV